MHKRGNAEVFMFLAVALVALGGVVFLLLPDSTTGQAYRGPPELRPGALRMTMLECQSMCFGRPIQTPRYQYPEKAGGQTLRDCLAQCQLDAGISPLDWQYHQPSVYVPGMSTGGIPPDDGSAVTGSFVIPAAKEYGGGISGVSAPGTRAFPAGRATEMPDQSCYTCSCMEQGITSATREAAEKVCRDNCGGDIVSIVVGVCE
ncbi:MAG: hypothetical protein QW165_05490 [Candidatus Woesearchaeota archaeon]